MKFNQKNIGTHLLLWYEEETGIFDGKWSITCVCEGFLKWQSKGLGWQPNYINLCYREKGNFDKLFWPIMVCYFFPNYTVLAC